MQGTFIQQCLKAGDPLHVSRSSPYEHSTPRPSQPAFNPPPSGVAERSHQVLASFGLKSSPPYIITSLVRSYLQINLLLLIFHKPNSSLSFSCIVSSCALVNFASTFEFISCSPLTACFVSIFAQQYSSCYCDSTPTAHPCTCIKYSSISKPATFNSALSDLLCICFSVSSKSSVFCCSPSVHHFILQTS